jgi:predicted transcriptional regulator YdeE
MKQYMTIIENNITTLGLQTELTKSQDDNFVIIQNHWYRFNNELKKHNLNQHGGNWVKYGITYKINERYFYLTTVPTSGQIFPEHFIQKVIPKGQYEVFTHIGEMKNIKTTVYDIYKNILPNSNLQIELTSKTGFIHFEKYDFRFQWNKPNSVIDIYLPLNTNFE